MLVFCLVAFLGIGVSLIHDVSSQRFPAGGLGQLGPGFPASPGGLGAAPGGIRGRQIDIGGPLGSLNPIPPLDPFARGGVRVNAPAGPPGGPGPLRAPSRPPQLSVELLFLVDKKARDEWIKKAGTGNTPAEREASAIVAMTEFLHSVVHGVNELYTSLM
ncbi:collagen alpha-2(I) chain, partial [Aplysia californica]|uniref:Collagen alpha-2(I) chain n=1 Tax=Aplysia californica TaxID=6500 RepID=A0ABM0JHJ3_APLCA